MGSGSVLKLTDKLIGMARLGKRDALICCTLNKHAICVDCNRPSCLLHFFKQRLSDEYRCLKCFRKSILIHRIGKKRLKDRYR